MNWKALGVSLLVLVIPVASMWALLIYGNDLLYNILGCVMLLAILGFILHLLYEVFNEKFKDK